MIFSNEITAKELPEVWNKKYQEYMGISPSGDAEGILQDTHWSWGEFGYFPSYAVGSAIAAQLYYHMLEKMPFDQYLKEGNITPIREYLRDSIHKYGATKNANQLLKDTTGEEFNADYYIKYLKEKYEALYEIKG